MAKRKQVDLSSWRREAASEDRDAAVRQMANNEEMRHYQVARQISAEIAKTTGNRDEILRLVTDRLSENNSMFDVRFPGAEDQAFQLLQSIRQRAVDDVLAQ